MASRVGEHQRNLHVDRFTLSLTQRWSAPLTGAKFTFDDFNTETRSTARSRQRSLSLFSLDDTAFASMVYKLLAYLITIV